MNHEVPRATPEKEQAPTEAHLFNVDAMSAEQLIITYRGYEALDLTHEDAATIGGLVQQLVTEIHDLVARDPERVKALVSQCEQSSNKSDRLLAVDAVLGLVYDDYEFTRDTLISIDIGGGSERSSDGGESGEYAHLRAMKLMRDHLTPEQVADYQAHFDAYNPGFTIEPAAPDEH